MPRPRTLIGDTWKSDSPFGHLYTTINYDENGNPREVFLRIGKAGTDIMAMSEGYGRLITLCLEKGGKLEDVVDQLFGIGGQSRFMAGDITIASLPDAIAQAFKSYLKEVEEKKTTLINSS